MNRSLRPYTLLAVAAIVLWFLENTFFSTETPGLKQQISVGFFFLGVAGVIGLIVIAVLALVRRRTART